MDPLRPLDSPLTSLLNSILNSVNYFLTFLTLLLSVALSFPSKVCTHQVKIFNRMGISVCSSCLVTLVALNGLSLVGEGIGAIAPLLQFTPTPVLSELTPEADAYTTPSINTHANSSNSDPFPDGQAPDDQPLDLEQASQRAKEASEQIYKGLDRTKREMGKTEMRKQAIEHGRDHASDKWEALAEKARRAKRGEVTLSPIDRFNLWRLQGRNH